MKFIELWLRTSFILNILKLILSSIFDYIMDKVANESLNLVAISVLLCPRRCQLSITLFAMDVLIGIQRQFSLSFWFSVINFSFFAILVFFHHLFSFFIIKHIVLLICFIRQSLVRTISSKTFLDNLIQLVSLFLY